MLPTNWHDYRKQLRDGQDRLQFSLDGSRKIIPQLLAQNHPFGVSRAFVTAPTELMQMWIAGGPDIARENVIYAGAPLARVAQALGESMRISSLGWLEVLAYLSMARALRVPTGVDDLELDMSLLRACESGAHDMTQDWGTSGALAELAYGLPERVPLWDRQGPLKAKTEPSQPKDRTLMAYARTYAELCIGQKDALPELRATYSPWVLGVFLDEIMDQTADWTALWWTAYVELVHHEGCNPNDLGNAFFQWAEALR